MVYPPRFMATFGHEPPGMVYPPRFMATFGHEPPEMVYLPVFMATFGHEPPGMVYLPRFVATIEPSRPPRNPYSPVTYSMYGPSSLMMIRSDATST